MCFIPQQWTTKPASSLTEEVWKADLWLGVYKVCASNQIRLIKYRAPTLFLAGPRKECCEALPREDGLDTEYHLNDDDSVLFNFATGFAKCSHSTGRPSSHKILFWAAFNNYLLNLIENVFFFFLNVDLMLFSKLFYTYANIVRVRNNVLIEWKGV